MHHHPIQSNTQTNKHADSKPLLMQIKAVRCYELDHFGSMSYQRSNTACRMPALLSISNRLGLVPEPMAVVERCSTADMLLTD